MESSKQAQQSEEKQQSRKRYDHLRAIEKQMNEVHLTTKVAEASPLEGYENMSFEEKNQGKYFTTFPYPYMNGFMHLGHAFSLSKCEFSVRYQKQLGKNVLFPFAFHCTGMPIQAAAYRLKREIRTGNITSPGALPGQPKHSTQYEILQQLGISEEDIPKFQDPLHWLHFFPPHGMQDLKDFGLYTDWRRSFITTEVNPFYDSFVQWQFNTLKAKDKIRFGNRPAIFSETDNQPCADHDRSKGEGVGPQEYTLIKIRCLELPASMQEKFADKTVFLVAATLRPETMYGQTNCYVLPEGEYGVFEMINNEYYVCSERSARNMSFQNMTKEHKQYPCLQKVSGQELIGLKLKAPLTKYEYVYALPMTTISMFKGTGIVTSVPSDAPDDWAALRDLQTKKGLREKYNVLEEWCNPFEPIPIIEIPGFGNMAAVKLVEEMKIQSQKDKDKLTEAKDKVYLKGFYEGVMLLGPCANMKVQDAKPIVRKQLIDNNEAAVYYEPENEVTSRSGDNCVVALCDQWFLTYGEEQWKETVKAHVKSENFNAYTPKTQQEFEETLEWLREWACSRSVGLGTKLPWDTQFLIESLSDSTIYMAYYTVAHLLQAGSFDGSVEGPLGIKASDLNDAVWEYIFKQGAYPEGCAIPEESLKKLRGEFEYWYPLDMRASGKDLIRNHLTMSLYNHAAVWEDPKYMPRSIFCNGWILVNGLKMSKSTGNFLTIRECIEKYGVDATRMALADAGDSLDDANFDENVANSAILRLFVLEKWISEEVKKHVPAEGLDFANQPQHDLWDQILDNELNYAIELTTKSYNDMRFKQALKHGFFELQALKEDYLIAKHGNVNPFLLLKYVETQLILINPIVPHFADYCYQTHVLPILEKSVNLQKPAQKLLINQGWPKASKAVDSGKTKRVYDYMKSVKSNVRMALEKAKHGGKKGAKAAKGKGKEAAPVEEKGLESCVLFVALEYPEWQKNTLETLQQFEFIDNKIQGNYIQAVKSSITGPKQGLALKFAAFIAKEAETVGKEAALEIATPFNEVDIIDQNRQYLFENMPGIKNISVYPATTDVEIENSKNSREAALPGKPSCFFF